MQEVKESWSDRMREEGRKAGVIEGKRETLLRQLTAKFGSLSADTIAKVAAVGLIRFRRQVVKADLLSSSLVFSAGVSKIYRRRRLRRLGLSPNAAKT